MGDVPASAALAAATSPLETPLAGRSAGLSRGMQCAQYEGPLDQLTSRLPVLCLFRLLGLVGRVLFLGLHPGQRRGSTRVAEMAALAVSGRDPKYAYSAPRRPASTTRTIK